MRISDIITRQILELLELSDAGTAEIQRNELASVLGCVPSQINYVLSSRFTPEQGYIVESRRGGGGYIRITRVDVSKSASLMHIVNHIGERLDSTSVRAYLQNMSYNGIISAEAQKLMSAALSDKVYRSAPPAQRDLLRAEIFKYMLVSLI